MADSKSTSTPPTADMQNLMTQLGAAAPNTNIIGSSIYQGNTAKAPAKL